MKRSTAYILRGISLAMFLYVLGSVLYGIFFDPIFQGYSFIDQLPVHYRVKGALQLLYFLVMFQLFALSCTEGTDAQKQRLNTVFTGIRYGLFVLILSLQAALLVLSTLEQYRILWGIMGAFLFLLVMAFLASAIAMLRNRRWQLPLLIEYVGGFLSLAYYLLIRLGTVPSMEVQNFRMFLLCPYLISLAVSFGLRRRLHYRSSAPGGTINNVQNTMK